MLKKISIYLKFINKPYNYCNNFDYKIMIDEQTKNKNYCLIKF